MRLRKEVISYLAQMIVDGLVEKEFIKLRGERKELERRIARAITDELMIEDKLNDEVREILRTYSSEIDRGNIDYGRMFQMVKNKLVKARGLIL